MAISIDVLGGSVDEGDTKRLTLTPTDGQTAASLAALSVVFTSPSGTEIEYTLADATQLGDEYILEHNFSADGTWLVDILGEGVQGATERESGAIIVRGKRRE